MRLIVGSLLVVLLLVTSQCQAGVVHVLTLGAARTVNAFATNLGYSVVRGDLLDLSLFGPSGIVPDSINLITPVSAITTASLTGTDVVLFEATQSTPTPTEISDLQSFVNSGGGLIVFGNNINSFASFVGGIAGPLPSSGNGTIVNTASPLASGPFGSLPLGSNFNLPYHGALASAGGGGFVGIVDSVGPFGISYKIGSGHVVLIGDEEIFLSSSPGFPALPSLQPATRMLFQNAFAYVIPASVPEPWSFLLCVIGLLVIASYRFRG